MYKTVLCFEMSIFTFFASTRKFKFFGQYLARTASKSTLKINTFSYSRYYTPKCLDSGRINRKLKKIFRRVNVRAKRTTRSFRITLARALSRLRAGGFCFQIKQRDHVLERDSFSARVRSASFGNIRLFCYCCVRPCRHNKNDLTP